MPLYEYYCRNCDGIFEALRSMRESSEPSSCPVCDSDSQRIMPTSFAAFTFRDGYPRRIPDDGSYYHLRKKVTTPIRSGMEMGPYQHPEIDKPKPKPQYSKGEKTVERERAAERKRLEKEIVQSGTLLSGPRGKQSVPEHLIPSKLRQAPPKGS
jgi:putative FmdB family regulatory protein